MHEIGIAEEILAAVLQAARGERVRRVAVSVGARQALDPERLALGFRLAAQDTCAEHALVELAEIPLRVRCVQCGEIAEGSGTLTACEACAGHDLEVLTGDELRVDRIELENGRLVGPTVEAI